jgi:choice-of-anchor A domain-containing protein
MTHFHVGKPDGPRKYRFSIMAREDIDLRDGNVYQGGLFAGRSASRRQSVTVAGAIQSGSGPGFESHLKELNDAADFYSSQSDRLAHLPGNASVSVDQEHRLTFSRSGKVSVFQVPEAELENYRNWVMAGDPSDVFVVNVYGSSARLSGRIIELVGIHASQLIFNFVDATSLTIFQGGVGDLGIPGTFLAPKACVVFDEATITGGLFVGGLQGTGQVNPANFLWEALNPTVPAPCACRLP